ncbi:hypothetical protein Cgig2_028846 [Carnegiea gigantea]|uniref:SGNH hydrolase-type esterase domain-containing protein n=1 Tax=Carnegiea gigantea TaxID=171969 RepID=A0A9Q1KRY2_9CARY|nr:hypothetical protein Cgig2_028846 [Carnegiea gigantea]
MRPKIYLFGDSITEESYSDGGWGASLTNHFSRTADIVLRGYSGYNTRWALRVLDEVFPPAVDAAAPVAVAVFFGANDACLPDRYASFQHVPLDEYKRNLHSIFSSLKKRWPSAVIVFITPPPVDEAARLQHPYCENPSGLPERTNEVAGAYAKACVYVAKDCGTPVVDIWTKMQELPDWKNLCLSLALFEMFKCNNHIDASIVQKWVWKGDIAHRKKWASLLLNSGTPSGKTRDGLHLGQSGNRIVFEEVVVKLREADVSLEKLPVDLPLFSEIDPKDPLKSF